MVRLGRTNSSERGRTLRLRLWRYLRHHISPALGGDHHRNRACRNAARARANQKRSNGRTGTDPDRKMPRRRLKQAGGNLEPVSVARHTRSQVLGCRAAILRCSDPSCALIGGMETIPSAIGAD